MMMEVLMVNGDRLDMLKKVENDSPVDIANAQDGKEGETEMETMDTSTIDAHDMDILRAESGESAMPNIPVKQIKSEVNHHVISSADNTHAIASHVYDQVEEAEIEKFLKEHPPTTDDAHRRDIKVAELRRIIPLLIVKLFNHRKDPTQKKVKGMWNEKPKNWPADLPYCDPNNHLKGEKGKPNQKILLRMFSFLVKNYMESHGLPYPEQEVAVSPLTHSVTASGSPVAIASRHFIKVENREAMVLGTTSLVPSSVTENGHGHVEMTNPVNQAAGHLQSSAMVTSTMSHPITSLSTVYAAEQPKLHALLQSTATPVKSRTKAPTVRELLPTNPGPQPLQQTIIIKPPAQIVNNHPGFQALQTMPDGQKYFLQSVPVLTRAPVPVTSSVSHIESFPNGTMVTTHIPHVLETKTSTAPIPISAPAQTPVPAPAFTDSVAACQSGSPPMDPLSVLSATAAKKQPLPVPNTEVTAPAHPPAPASHLHVIQPASAQHEMMDTTHAAEENTPVQVDEDDWDPFIDLKVQCSKKLKCLQQKTYLDTANSARLNIIKDLLDKMYMVREHDPEFFISTAHEFVSTLDIIKATRKVPESHMTKWREFEGFCKDRLLAVLRKAYPRVLRQVERHGLSQIQRGAWYKALNAPHAKTPKVVNEVEINTTTTSEKDPGSTVNFSDLGITPMTPVNLGTMEQLQMKGELNLRIIHNNDQTSQADQEVEAIKNDLKLYDAQLRSPPASSVDSQSVIQEPETPGSTTSKDHLEDIEQVLIMESIKDSLNVKLKQKAYDMEKGVDVVPPSPYVSVDEPEVSNVMMNYRDPASALSPQYPQDQMSPDHTFAAHQNDVQPVGVHWTQFNGQPPGSTFDTSGQNSIAAELMEKITTTEGIPGTSRGGSMTKLAKAYLDQIARNKVSSYGDGFREDQFLPGNNPNGPEVYPYNNGVPHPVIPTVMDEVQDVFEKSDFLGPPPAKRAAKRRSSEITVN